MNRTIRVILALLLVGCALYGEESIGEITYLEGRPEIMRDGDLLYETIDFGFHLENFDSIRTDATSSVELRFDPATGIDGTIAVRPETQFAINVSSLKSEQTGTVELLNGSIDVVARELTGRSRLQIRTQSSVAGVRGTTFTVTTSVGGEVLVSTVEGLVEVSDDQGFVLFASPGEAVEVDTERNVIRNLKYDAGAISSFRRLWLADRLELFRANAPRVLRFYGRRYVVSREQFVSAYRELMGNRDIIDRWIEESRRGIIGSGTTLIQEKRRIAQALLGIQPSMFVFEHTRARLVQMAAFVSDIAAAVEVSDNLPAAGLYRMLEIERTLMSQRLATVRQISKLFADRNDGESPTDVFGGFNGFGIDEFFGEDDDAGE